MINKLASYAVGALLLAGTVGGQEPFQVTTTTKVASFQIEKGRYLLVYRESLIIQWCSPSNHCTTEREDKLTEQEVYKFFPTIEDALTYMNQGTEPRVSKKMFVSLSYVIDLPLDLESETVKVNREVSKWRVKQ